ncbi:MAG TPA: hypothetical protein VF456_30155 [Vicinamibacterales bacterium]
MARHTAHEPHHDDVAHEGSDINVRAIARFGVGLLVLGAVVYLVVWLFFVFLSDRASHASAQLAYPLAAGQQDRVPPEPRLQTNPRADLREMRESEDKRLDSYGWVDRNAGIVHIPIDDAIKLTLQRGLPARPATEQQVVK